MAHTSPLTGSRIIDLADAPNGPQAFSNAVLDLEDNTIPRFSTASARDAAFATWTAAGNSLASGLTCFTQNDGRYWRYDTASSSWLYAGGNPPPIVTCSAGSGWSQAVARSPGVYRDASGMICLVGSISPNSAYNPEDAATHTALQIPTGYRPAMDSWVTLPVSFPGLIAIGFIKAADGILYITSATQSITVGAGQLHVLDGIRYHPTYAGSALP